VTTRGPAAALVDYRWRRGPRVSAGWLWAVQAGTVIEQNLGPADMYAHALSQRSPLSLSHPSTHTQPPPHHPAAPQGRHLPLPEQQAGAPQQRGPGALRGAHVRDARVGGAGGVAGVRAAAAALGECRGRRVGVGGGVRGVAVRVFRFASTAVLGALVQFPCFAQPSRPLSSLPTNPNTFNNADAPQESSPRRQAPVDA